MKAYFFDIDNTLLSHNTNSIPQSTLDSLKELKNQGNIIFVATGRHYLECSSLPDIFDGMITLNGGYCFNKDTVIYDNPIHPDSVSKIVSFVEEHHMSFLFLERDMMYINSSNDYVRKAQEAIHQDIPQIYDMHHALTHAVYQIDPYVENKNMIEPILSIKGLTYTKWHEYGYDIIPSNNSKATAIKKVCEHYHINIKDTIAFGDSDNDIEMLECVGLGIAMGNAHEHVKEIADYITTDIDDNGIYNALKHFHMI